MNIQLLYQSIAQMSDNQQCTVLVKFYSYMDDILKNRLKSVKKIMWLTFTR